MPPIDAHLAPAWLAAVRDPAIAAELESIYAAAAEAIAERKPVCVASGRCCHFEAHGHRLYVTGLEAAYTVSRSSPSALGGGGGRVPEAGGGRPCSSPAALGGGGGRVPEAGGGRIPLPILTSHSLASATSAGSCPYLVGTLCSVHDIKPLSCRTYYCDPTAQQWQQDLTERLLARIRALHDRHHIEYRYAEWRSTLAAFAP